MTPATASGAIWLSLNICPRYDESTLYSTKSLVEVIADALELGPLRNTEKKLSEAFIEKLSAVTPMDIPLDVITTLILYYMANRQDGTEWVALPVTNFEAYFGTSFGRKYLPKLPKEVFERSDSGYGVGRYLVKPEYLPQI